MARAFTMMIPVEYRYVFTSRETKIERLFIRSETYPGKKVYFFCIRVH